jgi:hypothetical protein
MTKYRMLRHTLEPPVDFFIAAVCRPSTPADDVIFKDTFMELVVDIGGEALEYVGMW